jgi:putative endonuclease
MFYFYILKCKDKSLYCGAAKDLKKREAAHNKGIGSKYVLSRGGGKIIYSEKFQTWSKALKREAEVKNWSRRQKQDLVKKLKLVIISRNERIFRNKNNKKIRSKSPH